MSDLQHKSGERVLRHRLTDRLFHWTMAVCMLVLLFTCAVVRWRASWRRALQIGAIMLVFALVMVNALAVLEFQFLTYNRVLADARIVQAVLFAAMAYILARLPVRRHDLPVAMAQA